MVLPYHHTLSLILAAALVPGAARADDAEWWRMEALRCDYEAHRKVFEIRLARREAAEAEFQAIHREAVSLRALAEETAARKLALDADIRALQAAVAHHKTEWIALRRSEQAGRKLASLRGPGDRVFKDVTISQVTDAGVEFTHATGSARLVASQLTPDQQHDFGIDAVASRRILDIEAERRKSYHLAVDLAEAKAHTEAQELIQASRVEDPIPFTPPATFPDDMIIHPRGGTLSQPAKPLGKRSTWRRGSFDTYYFTPYRRYPRVLLTPCDPSPSRSFSHPSMPRTSTTPHISPPVTP